MCTVHCTDSTDRHLCTSAVRTSLESAGEANGQPTACNDAKPSTITNNHHLPSPPPSPSPATRCAAPNQRATKEDRAARPRAVAAPAAATARSPPRRRDVAARSPGTNRRGRGHSTRPARPRDGLVARPSPGQADGVRWTLGPGCARRGGICGAVPVVWQPPVE